MDNVYKTPESKVTGDDSGLSYAGFWIRALAAVIDSVWMMLFIVAVGMAYYGSSYLESEEAYKGTLDIILQYVFPALVTIAFWMYKSATPGKMAVRVKIVDAVSLEPASKWQLVGRYLAYYPSMIVLFFGFIWIAFDPKKQAWHDKMAKTIVIKS